MSSVSRTRPNLSEEGSPLGRSGLLSDLDYLGMGSGLGALLGHPTVNSLVGLPLGEVEVLRSTHPGLCSSSIHHQGSAGHCHGSWVHLDPTLRRLPWAPLSHSSRVGPAVP